MANIFYIWYEKWLFEKEQEVVCSFSFMLYFIFISQKIISSQQPYIGAFFKRESFLSYLKGQRNL